jgi:invasion protein IalB
MAATGASAQDAENEVQITPKKVQSAPKAAAPAAKAPAAAAGATTAAAAPKSAWVKLCEKAPLMKKDKDGKEVKDEKQLCLTHHERLDGNTGMVLVSAAIREIEGNPKKTLMVMVPLGMAIPPGLRAAVYSKEDWAKATKNEKIDEAKLKPIELHFSLCNPAGGTAET